jgi:ATP-dependent RNA helicase RhlE
VTFEELNISRPILNALNDLGLTTPTPIQEQVFSEIRSGKDVIAISQTGTGKTLAYLLPLLSQLKYSDQRQPRILIVVPTRELVLQVAGEIEKLAAYMRVRVVAVYGGTNISTQKQLVYKGVDILVATPGRLIDIALSGELRLKTVKTLVIDEVDEMLNLGFRAQLANILDMLPEKRQNLMFSATFSPNVEELTATFFRETHRVGISAHGTPLEQIIQKGYYVPNFFTKVNLLEYLLADKDFEKVLVFFGSKRLADRLHEQLEPKFPGQLCVIHSNKSQNSRINAIRQFGNGTHRVLIATDIAARGLDIADVTHVINFDTPEVPEDYIHRIGRTGRADKAGEAIIFINEPEKIFQAGIEALMKRPIPIAPLPADVVVSTIFTEEEKPFAGNINYLKIATPPDLTKGFQAKKEKNSKTNQGGSYKRKLAAKYKKRITRGNKP